MTDAVGGGRRMQPGTVSLVGAGPGDPDLLTVKARRLLEDADAVLYDSLVSEAIRDLPPASVERIDVGKRGDGERTTQAAINDLLVRRAAAGDDLVRLKSGDPYVFGRGGEEAEHLAAAGIPFEVVPGITSAVAGPSLIGVPATHRDHASSLTVVTGHEDPTKEEGALDWDALARSVSAGGTLVILMGVGRLPDNVAALRAGGVAPDTPVAMVERASRPDEFAVTGTLDTITDRAQGVGIDPPAVTVVGDVVSVRDRVADALRAAGTVRSADAVDDPAVPTE
ncbi:uroporphyrinogen-III C-methyltransferase [Haloplanus salinarum]|uniref:uroporphyrinogen-III C-methyltransferase n=1 Tax=Haloplanus salinarum TaxID=1912324 RepID=UPI00214AEE1D|nr:uroporphyrinogen-III C-methyltransferase [Haloplanus salinarum]